MGGWVNKICVLNIFNTEIFLYKKTNLFLFDSHKIKKGLLFLIIRELLFSSSISPAVIPLSSSVESGLSSSLSETTMSLKHPLNSHPLKKVGGLVDQNINVPAYNTIFDNQNLFTIIQVLGSIQVSRNHFPQYFEPV